MARVREGGTARDAEVRLPFPRMRWPRGVRPLLELRCMPKRSREVSGARVCAAHGDANGSGVLQDSAIDA